MLFLVGAAAVVLSAVAVSSASSDALPVVSFVDPAGDSGGEVDITLVSVGFDQATEMITFAVTVTGFDPGSWNGRYRNIQVYLDTALHSGQRSGGADLSFQADAGPYGIVGVHVGHPNQNTGRLEPLPPTISFSQSGNVLTWVFNKAELGVTEGSAFEGFNFLIYTQIPGTDGLLPVRDNAPDGGGSGSYYVPTQPAPQPVVVSPVFGSTKAVPSRPVAGKKLVLTLAVNRSDTGAPLTTGTMTCDPSVAGKALKHTESLTNGKARLALMIPKTAKGKLLKVKVKITNGAQSATRVITYRVT